MKRALIIAIVIIIVGLIATTVIMLLSNTKTTTIEPVNTAVTTNTAETPERVIVSREEKGSIEVAKTLSYRGTTLTILNASELDAFHRQTPRPGNKYVLLFLAPLKASDTNPSAWIGREGKIVSSNGVVSTVLESETVSESSDGANTGYLWFETGNDEHNFRLVYSDGSQESTLELGF